MAHPIVQWLEDRGIRQTWLARRINRSVEHTNRVLHEVHPATAEFRVDCARALGVDDESLLFHGAAPSEQPLDGDAPNGCSDGRASTAVVQLNAAPARIRG